MGKKRYEIRLSGSGGQGMILGGVILAEAAAIHDGINATQTQSYGPEARVGASKSEVIISDGEILFPKTSDLDVLLCLTQKAAQEYIDDLKEDGILIIDSYYVGNVPSKYKNIYKIPFSQIANKEFNTTLVVNIIALGAICAATGCVSEKALFEAVKARVPKGTQEINEKAARLGIKLVKEQK
ncbi:MAG: 2-oxoglutarate ferredoxin oxidoreductase subunit gamma [Candidatus Muiribacterium halophilum]|uniref:2-oxoglutarate ferredoxin oxidoreductase subunit gamma n=1 Tax=Muiribacterium halophilum TaxID=2053465 RepID=A0A2N5ZGG7_MUIH1|nr:MAG: 2-oxoglutarate ferredoxin oxidoreductase subunit gamma [Candidatus Muirbacterium halophilum]